MKLFTIFFLGFCFLLLASISFAQDLQTSEIQYLRGKYQKAIETLEGILALDVDRPSLAKVYYLLGLSYLKDGNYIRADDCFDIIVKEYQRSNFRQPALIKLIDIDLIKGNFQQVLDRCEKFLARYPKYQRLSSVLFRQYLAKLKLGNWLQARVILAKMNKSSPHSPEMKTILEANLLVDYFSVQVGSFKKRRNAQKLMRTLKYEGFDSFVIESKADDGQALFRVRVGRLKIRDQAKQLEKQLIQQGYATKIYP